MANNVFTTNFYKMLKNNIDIRDHIFVCYRGGIFKYLLKENEYIKFGNIESLKINVNETEKIIVHGLLEHELFNWLYYNPEYLNIC